MCGRKLGLCPAVGVLQVVPGRMRTHEPGFEEDLNRALTALAGTYRARITPVVGGVLSTRVSGMDHQLLVDQVVLHERLRELPAADDPQVLACWGEPF